MIIATGQFAQVLVLALAPLDEGGRRHRHEHLAFGPHGPETRELEFVTEDKFTNRS